MYVALQSALLSLQFFKFSLKANHLSRADSKNRQSIRYRISTGCELADQLFSHYLSYGMPKILHFLFPTQCILKIISVNTHDFM